MTKKSWDHNHSRDFHREEKKKEDEILGPEIESAGGSFDPLLALSYSSSAAPIKNDYESSTPPVTLDDESTAPPIGDDDSSAAPASSDDEPLTIDDESTKEPPDDAEEDSMLGSGFGSSLDARLRELDEASDKPSKEVDDEEPQDETTDDAEEEDTEENIDSAVADTISLKSSSSVSKVVSSQSSKDQESETSASEGNESPEEPSDASSDEVGAEDVLEGPPEESTEQIEQEKPSRRLKPPLFPGRSRPNKRSLKGKMKPGIASFFRSRSTPPSKTNKLNKNVVERATASLDGRVENARDSTSMSGSVTGGVMAESSVVGVSVTGISDAGSATASVHSCSEKSVEVVTVHSTVTSVPEYEPVEALHHKQGPLPPATAKPKVCEAAESVANNASSDAEVCAKTMHETMDKISTEMSRASDEIQDPWPNPWAEDAGTLTLGQVHSAPGLAMNPHIVSKEAPADSVLENVVGVVLSSGVAASASMEGKVSIESYVALDTTDLISVDNILTYPATLNPNLVVASLAEEARTNAAFEGEQTAEEFIDQSSHQGEGSCEDQESESEKREIGTMESPDTIWKELLASEESSTAGLLAKAIEKKEEEQGENNGEARRQSSLWKRTKSIVRTRRNSHKNLYQAGEAAKNGKVTASTKKQKFKLGYLCLFSPCGSKQLATIEEAEIEHDNLFKSGAKAKVEAKANPVAALTVVTPEIESFAEEATDETNQACDDLVEGLDNTESSDVQSPDSNSIQTRRGADDSVAQVDVSQGTLNSCRAKARKPSRVKEGTPEIEETKSDLVQLDLANSNQNSRSWITDLPSGESLMGQQGPQKTFSDFSSIGDVSGGVDGPNGPNMISSINYYVAAASKAVQENLYDRPVRELERLRDFSCAGAEEQSSLASMSNDSGQANKRTGAAVGTKKSANFFSIALSELVDVLECTPLANSPRKTTRLSSPNKRFEEQKIEMFGSTSGE